MDRIFFLTNSAPHYRLNLWEAILNNPSYKFDVFFGGNQNSGIEEIDFECERFRLVQNQIHKIKNRYYKKKILVWQDGVLNRCLTTKAHTAILTGDSWVISNWLAAIIFRIRNIKVVFWSHGFYGNESTVKKRIRTWFFKLADEHILYERRGKKLMVERGFNENRLHVIFNSLDYEKSLSYRKESNGEAFEPGYPYFRNRKYPTLIFVGRLTKVKKLDYLINSIEVLVKDNFFTNLLFVGDGPEKDYLISLAEKCNITEYIHFYGSCYSEVKLAKLISKADLCVSPGNVGLTAIHSLSYGTPVLTHNNFENQMPEAESIENGKSGLFFKENDLDSMVEAIKCWLFENKMSRKRIRLNCYGVIDKYYNPNYQVMVLENLLANRPPKI